MTRTEEMSIAKDYVIRKERDRATRLGKKYGLIIGFGCLAFSAFVVITTIMWR